MAAQRYGPVAKFFHWTIFVLLVAAFILGLTIGDMTTKEQMANIERTKLLFDSHKSIGLLIFILAFLRLAWRHIRRPPPLPAGMPGWERMAAQASHFALYVLMFAIPIVGWLVHTASPFERPIFGFLNLPDVLASDAKLEHTLKEVHYWLAMALVAVVAIHILAAIKHHIIDRDDVLTRMLPFTRS